jgi:hypothetical protein
LAQALRGAQSRQWVPSDKPPLRHLFFVSIFGKNSGHPEENVVFANFDFGTDIQSMAPEKSALTRRIEICAAFFGLSIEAIKSWRKRNNVNLFDVDAVIDQWMAVRIRRRNRMPPRPLY